ncbi:unnamed protein product [Caretta caretta]
MVVPVQEPRPTDIQLPECPPHPLHWPQAARSFASHPRALPQPHGFVPLTEAYGALRYSKQQMPCFAKPQSLEGKEGPKGHITKLGSNALVLNWQSYRLSSPSPPVPSDAPNVECEE